MGIDNHKAAKRERTAAFLPAGPDACNTLRFNGPDDIIFPNERKCMEMRSMTGCGAGSAQRNGWEVKAELKSVNHRFLDISMRLPRNIAFLEQTVREAVGSALKRGHVDVFITVTNAAGNLSEISVDSELARKYLEAGKALSQQLGAENDLTVSNLIKMEGVITLAETDIDQDTVKSLCTEAVNEAVLQLISMREREGKHLKEDLCLHLEKTALLREEILKRAPLVVQDYKEKLELRLRNLIADGIDESRLAQEVAVMTDRCAIDEELARLNSHVLEMNRFLETEGEIGKKMDFLIQEMNRETNTIGSKAQDAEIAKHVVEMKSEIEKLREQIQNVE